VLDSLSTSVDEIYFATCIKKATAVMGCPMKVDAITAKLEEKFGIPVHMGTHDY
jgi:predicted metal-binding protein